MDRIPQRDGGQIGTRPAVGLWPKMPLHVDGMRIEERCDHLRAGVLNFHAAIEAEGFRQGFAGSKDEGVRQTGDFGG